MFPAWSVALTDTVNVASGCPLRSYVVGDEQGVHADRTVVPLVNWHWNVAPGSSVNDQLGEVLLPGVEGGLVIVGAAGGVESRM